MECTICMEKYNRSNRKKVCCPYCEYESCRECNERYITGEEVEIPNCMNCKKEWKREVLIKKFTKKFVDIKLKKHREEKLFEREKSLFQSTQSIVEDEIRKEKIIVKMRKINEKIKNLKNELFNLKLDYSKPKEKKIFIKACPAEGCRGFLSTQWKCGLCDNYTCPDCHEFIGEYGSEHTCKQENIESAKLLVSETKNCPKCTSMIYKIDGCDQMWCTQCHTAFSWRTGKIETKIHNPHYYEYMRRNGGMTREIGEIECGNELNHHMPYVMRLTINRIREKLQKENSKEEMDVYMTMVEYIERIIPNIIHLREVEIPRNRVDVVLDNQDLRIKYMKNEIDEEKFKNMLQKRMKSMEKKREIVQIIDLVIKCITDIIFRYHEKNKNYENETLESYSLLFKEIKTIKDYANDCLSKIYEVYATTAKYYLTDYMILFKEN